MIINLEREYFVNIDLIKSQYPRIWDAFLDEELGYDNIDFLELVIETVGIDDVIEALGALPENENVRIF